MITNPERAGLRQHAEDRLIDEPRRIEARSDDAELHGTDHTSNKHRTLIQEGSPDGAQRNPGRPSRIPLRFIGLRTTRVCNGL
jgi:hypothetical protein